MNENIFVICYMLQLLAGLHEILGKHKKTYMQLGLSKIVQRVWYFT